MAVKKMRGVKPDPRGNGKWIAIIPDPNPGTPAKRKFSFDSEEEALRAKANVKATLRSIDAKAYQVPANVADVVKWLASDKREGYRNGEGSQPHNLDTLIKLYLEPRKNRVDKKLLSHSQYNQDEWFLKFFANYFDNNSVSVAEALSESSLDDYRSHIESHFESKVSQRHALRITKALIEWAYERHHLEELPRNLKRFRKLKVDDPKPNTMELSEFVRLHDHSTESMQLYILLALNCGYTQIDIATLDHSMIDWTTGRIDRSRHKTQNSANTPQYAKLWKRTLSMLKAQATKPNSTKDNLVLLSRDNNALVRPEDKVDNVQRAFNRLKQKTKTTHSFRNIRATGADLIKNKYVPHADNPRTKTNSELFDLYLAHKPPQMVRHYDAGDWSELFQATDWLGEQLERAFLEGGKES